MRKRFISLLMCGVMSILALTGCSGGKEKKADETKQESTKQEEKVITVGCNGTTPGWAGQGEDGNVEGYDYDVWQEIGKRIGYDVEFKVMEWDTLWSMVDQGRLDTVGNQVTRSAEREERYHLSEPYAYNIYCLLSAKDNEELQSMDDLKTGMKIACQTNSSDEDIVESINKTYNIELAPTFYDGMSVQDVALGGCDVWPRAETSCELTVKEMDNLKILGKTNVLEVNVYPFAKTERGEELSKLVSGAIKEMHEDGTLKELSEKWFGKDVTVKPEGAEELK